MTYETLATRNVSSGFQVLFVYVNDITSGLFINLFLFALFLVIMLGSYFSAKRLSNNPDISVSFAVAGYITFGLALILSLIPGLINIFTVVVTLTISILGTLWLWMSKSTN